MVDERRYATEAMLRALAEPTPPDEIGTRKAPGGGTLDYIDARFVFDRFDAALGPDLWQSDIEWTPVVRLEEKLGKKGQVIEEEVQTPFPMARLGVLCKEGWVWKQDLGDFSDIASVKGSVSDSIKRAAVQWGVGRDLYPKPKDKQKGTNSRRSEQTEQAEQAVVGRTGLTSAQRGKLFSTMREAGIPDEKRKDIVKTMTGKDSVRDMTSEDMDLVIDFCKGSQYQGETEDGS